MGRLSRWLAIKANRRFNAICIGRPFSFQGGFAGKTYPGLKPWAKICNRFAVSPTAILGKRRAGFGAVAQP